MLMFYAMLHLLARRATIYGAEAEAAGAIARVARAVLCLGCVLERANARSCPFAACLLLRPSRHRARPCAL